MQAGTKKATAAIFLSSFGRALGNKMTIGIEGLEKVCLLGSTRHLKVGLTIRTMGGEMGIEVLHIPTKGIYATALSVLVDTL